MNEFLNSILCEPTTKDSLKLEGNFYIGKNGKYPIINDIPIFLQNPIEQNLSSIHNKYSSDFNYIDHYKLDGEYFDYFLPYECEATNDEFRRIHQAIDLFLPQKFDNILDIGCGSGWVAKEYSHNKQVVSVDISFRNVKTALELYNNPNHSGIVADVYSLPFKDESFDVIIASEVIEHTANPKLFIETLLKLLKKNGCIIITTPYNEKIEYQLCVHCNKLTPKHGHLHSFNEINIKELIPQNIHFEYLIFGNKYLGRIRSHIVLGFLPFRIWRIFDKLSNLIKYKPIRFLIKIVKN